MCSRSTRRATRRSRSSTASPNRPRNLLKSLALTAVLLVAFVATGCGAVGRVTAGDPSQGKTLFQQKCAACHTLADANAQGTVGPNLDDAFSSDKDQGFSQQDIADVVRGQIAYADPQGPMKPNLVRGLDADSVALYVAKCSANPSCGVTAANPSPPASSSGGGTTTTSAPAPPGKAIFTANCGSCHTLKDAGATGAVGPNLDGLKPSESKVQKQVTTGGAIMPSFKSKLSAAQIQDVAKYVSSVAGK